MTYGMIATWRMAYEGIQMGMQLLEREEPAKKALIEAIKQVEDYPFYKSVGYGGLPNAEGVVQLDAAFMDGETLAVGAVGGLENIANPIAVAEQLSHEQFNSFLVGTGAETYAKTAGFPQKELLTDRAKRTWELRVEEVLKNGLSPYDGHDTVGMVSLDTAGRMVAGTSSSGLFMKKPGRLGDSPLAGAGFYVDNEYGGATATGLGEDLMKGALSYETVRLMKEGYTPQAAVDKAVYDFDEKLKERRGKAGAMSLVCMNNQGEWGVATNVEFSFVVGTTTQDIQIYIARPNSDKTTKIEIASEEWLANYEKRIKKPIE